jgi:signal transduction histidine kinase
VAYIISETDRLNNSVRQILTFSRPAPDGAGTVDISQLLEDVSRTLSREHSEQQIRIVRRIEPGLVLKQSDRQSFQQIVLNLTLNAIQASGSNGVVQLDAGSADGKIVIAITDGGPGIAPELRDRVFEPFFTTKQKGTGLGLAIVKKNVHNLGGDIRLESPIAEGHGTRITVMVPIE